VQPEFSEHVWNAFLLTAIEDKPAAEVAAELGMSVGSVYVAKSRVIGRLRERVASVTGDVDLPEDLT
jgi:RNA polymerase sigma-70 factor (ECF subfamily)